MEWQSETTEEGNAERTPHEWVRLIRKLRWIGQEDEARRLEELIISALPAEERASVSFGPFSTD